MLFLYLLLLLFWYCCICLNIRHLSLHFQYVGKACIETTQAVCQQQHTLTENSQTKKRTISREIRCKLVNDSLQRNQFCSVCKFFKSETTTKNETTIYVSQALSNSSPPPPPPARCKLRYEQYRSMSSSLHYQKNDNRILKQKENTSTNTSTICVRDKEQKPKPQEIPNRIIHTLVYSFVLKHCQQITLLVLQCLQPKK